VVLTESIVLFVFGTLSLAWYSRKNSQQDLNPVSSQIISQVIWNLAPEHTARKSLTDVTCYVTPGKSLTPVVSM